MSLDCYGILYEGDTCIKYMKYLRGPVLNALEELATKMSYDDPIFKMFDKYKGPLLSQYPAKKVDLGGGYVIILYWI